MKKIKYVSLLALALVFGCSDFLDVNTDPNNPRDAHEKLVLPAAQQSIAARVGGYYRITGSIWSQHYTQNNQSSQYVTIDNYDVDNAKFLEGDFIEMYSGPLNDLKFVKEKAEGKGNWTNYLIATVMEAYAFQLMADMYDGAPIIEGLQGDEYQFTPHWNTGPEVYTELLARIDAALAKPMGTGTDENPEENDLLFGGDVDRWIRFANTLKLKIMIRYSAVDAAQAQTLISALVNSGAEFLETDAAITTYYDEPDRSNPLYETDRRNLNTPNNLKASLTMVNYLEINNDSRLNELFDLPTADGSTVVVGMRQGTSSTAGTVLDSRTVSGARVLPTDPVYFISLPEAYFLRAEAAARGFSSEDAQSLYESGVLAAFDRFDLDGAAYLEAGEAYEYPNGTIEENVEAIIEQKWIAQVGGNSMEAWFDKLRTGYPAFSNSYPGGPGYDPTATGSRILSFPVDAVTFAGDFPRRFMIPEDEVLNNPNAPEQPAEGILTPVWWDPNN